MKQALIEPARMEDLPRLAQLLCLLFEQEADFKPDTEKQLLGLHLIMEHPEQGQLLVARLDKDIAGMVNLLTTISTAEGGRTLILEDLIVAPAFRGQGMGRSLVEAALRFARDHGYLRVSVHTERVNAAARKLFRSFGFVESDMLPLRLNLKKRL